VKSTPVAILVSARSSARGGGEEPGVEDFVEKVRGLELSATTRIVRGMDLVFHQPSENAMDNRLEDPSRQSRGFWDLAEEVERLPEVFFLC
jgi:hypothetical protein